MIVSLLSAVFFYTKLCYAEHIFDPPSRSIEIIEGGRYTVGIRKTVGETQFFKCQYTTDVSTISGTFDVANVTIGRPEQLSVRSNNEVRNYGSSGDCRVKFSFADDVGPMTWTFQAFDANGNSAAGPTTFSVRFFYRVTSSSNSLINVYEKNDFFVYLDRAARATHPLESCSVRFDDTTVVSLSLTSSDVTVVSSSQKTDPVIAKMSSMGTSYETRCGFRINDTSHNEQFQWTLAGTDSQDKRYASVVTSLVAARPHPASYSKREEVLLGDQYKIFCGDKMYQSFCELYRPTGLKVYIKNSNTICLYSIDIVTLDDLGTWKCITNDIQTIQNITYIVELVEKEEETIETWADEKDNQLNLGCRYLNHRVTTSSINNCKLTSPGGTVFSPFPGLAIGRFSSFGAVFQNRSCGMSVQLPLENSEIGNWYCTFALGGITAGSFITVRSSDGNYPKYKSITARKGGSINLDCWVPYRSSYCHFTAPNGTSYATMDHQETLHGLCTFKIDSVELSDNGTWTCSFGRSAGLPDELLMVELTVAEVLLKTDPNVEVDEGDNAVITCSTGGLPISYCRFKAPDGSAYQLDESTISTTSLGYYGRGLARGDCGVRLTKVQTNFAGTWTCSIRIRNVKRENELSARVQLEVNPGLLQGNSATVVGVTVGVLVVAVGLTLYMVIRWKRRRALTVRQFTNEMGVGTDDFELDLNHRSVLVISETNDDDSNRARTHNIM